MKDFEKTIKENIIVFVGSGLFTYGLFKFLSIIAKPGTRYYQENINSTLIYLVIGVIFIVFWLVSKGNTVENNDLNKNEKSIGQSLNEYFNIGGLPDKGWFIVLGILILILIIKLLGTI